MGEVHGTEKTHRGAEGGHLHVEDTSYAERTRVPSLLVLFERWVERIGELADDRDGPLGTWKAGLLLLIVVLLCEEERGDHGEDGKHDSGAIGLLKRRYAREIDDGKHLAERRVGLNQGRGRRGGSRKVEALLASVEDGSHVDAMCESEEADRQRWLEHEVAVDRLKQRLIKDERARVRGGQARDRTDGIGKEGGALLKPGSADKIQQSGDEVGKGRADGVDGEGARKNLTSEISLQCKADESTDSTLDELTD